MTCKNRLWQLRHTFNKNISAIEADECSELVLLNYNSTDELNLWTSQFESLIQEGYLRYAHEQTDPCFHCSKAKNLAHFAATGDFVVNLDADNFIGDTISTYREIWSRNSDTIIHGFCGDLEDGSFGRIGMFKKHFIALGGYDEEMLPFGHQDSDLIKCGKAMGLNYVRLKQDGVPAIRNNMDIKMKYSGSDLSYHDMAKINFDRMEENLRLGRLVANQNRKTLSILLNFSDQIII